MKVKDYVYGKDACYDYVEVRVHNFNENREEVVAWWINSPDEDKCEGREWYEYEDSEVLDATPFLDVKTGKASDSEICLMVEKIW